MESLGEQAFECTSSQEGCNASYDSELASILNNTDAFEATKHSTSLFANGVKADSSFCFKLDSKPSCDFANVDTHISLSCISNNSFHCDNILDAPENMLPSTGNTFHDGTLDYSLSCQSYNAPPFEGIESQKNHSNEVKIPSVEPCSVENNHQVCAQEHKLNSTENAMQSDCPMGYDKPENSNSEESKDMPLTVTHNATNSEKLATKPCCQSVSPCINNNKLNSEVKTPNVEANMKCEENMQQTTKNDETQTKSEEDFSNTSPISNEELSLDSGVASLDDNEGSKASPSEENTNNNAVLKKERKRLRSSLSKPEKCTSVKRKKSSSDKMVSFCGVTVFYFSRRQSFVTVPSQGGSTLGMSLSHNHMKKMSLKQHRKSVIQRRRSMEREQNRQQRISMKLKQLKQAYPNLETSQLMPMVVQSEPEEESSDSSSASEDIDDDDNTDDNYFLQPISTKKRRLLLRMSGVQKIDSEEKLSNKLTRESREICGCDCNGICLPSTCLCALSGIPCQVDRESFPCGCTAQGCSNTNGRVEFDAERVRTHYSRTMRRLRIEETGMTSSQDVPVNPALELRQSPYVAAGNNNGEMFESTAAQASQLSTACNTGCTTTLQQLGEEQCCSSNTTNFNQSNNGHRPFSQTAEKGWYMENTCKNVYQNSNMWNSAPSPHPNQHYNAPNISFLPRHENAVEGQQYMEPQAATHALPVSSNNYLNDCIYSVSENEMCFPAQYGASHTKATPLDIAVNEASTFRLDPIASFFPQVETVDKITSRATVYDNSFTATNSVASTLASCQNFNGITYHTEMESLPTGLNFQTCDSDNLSIATSSSEHGQDAVDVVA
uniref:Cysteine/serine-rich nuclear protein 1 n=1 Tax=Phallusia mammillata TaxID=59560 RepID=A0A6F9DAP2_9ASCI|nr:cysteine/serine-rich nuclear protein 1 [Phallusia mammillata]